MNGLAKAAAVLFVGVFGGACLSGQTADIGKITLSAPNFGYQTVGVYNLTGATQGCEQYQAQYNVCNGLNIASWQLTVNFTANATGLATSPLVFTSNGAADQIPPTASNFTAYTGEAANPWSLSFSLQNAGCSPSCDATISSITFSGTLDTTSLNLYNTSASGPYILDSLPSSAFSVTWNIPATDYTANPGSLFDSTDILITNQPQLTSQTITFGPLSDLLLTATPPALSATATSNLAVSFNSNNTSVCTVSTTTITLVSAGLCSITASQPGNSTYAAATPVTQTFNVTQAPQTITFGPLSDLAINATPAALSATATSNLVVVFTSNTTPVCTVMGTAITLVSGGTCSITANQPGNTIYAPAATVTQTFQVTLTPQTITFGPISNQLLTVGGTLALTATASSNLALSYTSNSTGVCTVANSTVTFVTTGTCSITANQAGNETVYAAAAPVTQTFNIQATQTITFGPIGNLALTATAPALSATSTSGLAVSFASTTPLVCTVSMTTVSLVAAGTCSITATQSGSPTYAAATPVVQTFIVQGGQTITFGPISNLSLTATAPALSATSTSGLVVTFASTTPLVCSVAVTTVTLNAPGTCSITASQSGNSNFTAAPDVIQTFTVLTPQTITFGPISNLAITATAPALSATASSTLGVTFTSNSQSVCTVSNNTMVALVTTGVCSITASQPGNGTYAPAPTVTQTFNVQSNQTITFGPISSIGLNATTPALSATATSGLAVIFTSNSTPVCTVAGTAVTLVTTGTCSISANQAGDATHAAAPAVTQTFTVQSAQTITFNPPGPQNLGTSPTLTATATSGLGVTFTSNSLPVCTVAVNTNTVTLLTTGTCSITANQAGDATHAAAPPVTQTFAVNLEPQTIAFSAFTSQPLGTSVPLAATATSTLGVTFTSNSLAVCTVVNNNSITLLTTGTCSITAAQAGNTTYAAAPTVTQTFTVTLEPQTITFGPINTILLTATPPPLSATASSALVVNFASNSGAVCTVMNTTVTLVATGTCSITATQAGNTTYAAATPVTQTFLVTTLTPQSIAFGPIAAQTIGVAPPALSATATSGLAVTLTSNSNAVCTVTNNTTLTLVSIGMCSITASQPGNNTVYAPATSITQTFAVNGTPQTISFSALVAENLLSTTPTLSATATSGLAVTFTSNSLPVCTVMNGTITLVSAGTCSITAAQTGSTIYAAAPTVTQTFAVNLVPQTISFGPISTILLTATAPPLSATATSTLVVNFASNSGAVCTVQNTTVTLVATGTCSITATQAGNSTYAAATPVTQTFLVTVLTPQSIAFGSIAAQTIGVAPPALSATATSGLAVTLTSNSNAVCTVTNNTTLTLVSIGTCSITASQPGNNTVYAPATSITQTFAVNGTPQTISFSALVAENLLSTTPTLSATATSGLAVTFTSNSLPVCTVMNGTITLVSAGTCSITAAQTGSTIYAAAPTVTQTFAVNLVPQTISFGPISTILLTATAPPLSATATSTLVVNFASNSGAVCTVQNTTVTLVATGTCSITATQAGNSTYAAATPVTQTFLVTTLTPQSITFGPLSSLAFGATPPALSATATSGLAVTFTPNSSAVCTVAGTAITLVSVGTCSITASQPGNNTVYAAATPITQTFSVTQGANVITFGSPGTQTLGQSPFGLFASASSGLAVTFASTTASVCTVSSSTLTLVASGTCTVTASQAGNANYVAATPVSQSFTVNAASSGGGGGGGGGGGVGGGTPLTIAPSSVTISAIANGSPGTAQIVLGYSTFTQGAPSFSTNFNTNQGQGWLSVAPSSGTMSLGSTTGLQFNYTATLTISADPTTLTAGQTYTGNVNVSAAGAIVTVPVTVNVSSTPAKYATVPSSLTFSYQLGSTATPPAQSVSVYSAPLGAGYTVSATSSGGSGNWLSATAASSSPITPSVIAVSVSTSGFTQAGQYSGQVAIGAGASTVNVPVTFNISAAQSPVLALAPAQETFSIPQGSSLANGQVTVSNAGGGTLAFTASATSANGWLSINGSGSGFATLSSPATVGFTINPQGLKPGVYSGQISVSGASTTRSTTIVLGITGPLPQIQLSRNGVTLSAVSNGSGSAPEVVSVSNSGGGTLQWSASATTLSGGNWLIVSPNTGTAQGGAADSTVSISANPGNLTPGTYSGSVNFTAQGAVNSPQTVSVTFTVSAATHQLPILAVPSGEILVGTAGATTHATANLVLFDLNAIVGSSPVAYSASTSASWLSVTPASGSISSSITTLQIAVDFSKLSGLNIGSVSIGFGDGSGTTVTVIAFALPASASGNAVGGLRPLTTVSACPGGKASFLIPVFQQPSASASLQASYATDVTVQVIDDCGKAVTAAGGGSVQVTFSNGDPGINLVDTGSGVWEGTWTPVTAASQVTLQIGASENGVSLNSASGVASSETVSVAAAGAAGPPQPTGIANAASAGQAIPTVVAPGSYVAIYGTNLAGSGNENATAGQPLPTTLNGAQLTLGGLPLPLLYASPTQVNAVIPQGIAPNATYPLLVTNGTTQSVPVSLTVTELQPGTYTVNTSGSGAGIVADALTGQLITTSNPAHAGQNLVIYMTGLGALTGANGEQEPADGAIAPITTIYHTQANVSVTIGGIAVASTQFAGLTPTLTALYQVNVQMPNGVTPGTAVAVVVTATDSVTGATATSNNVTIAVQ